MIVFCIPVLVLCRPHIEMEYKKNLDIFKIIKYTIELCNL